jgi:hypothetical protein
MDDFDEKSNVLRKVSLWLLDLVGEEQSLMSEITYPVSDYIPIEGTTSRVNRPYSDLGELGLPCWGVHLSEKRLIEGHFSFKGFTVNVREIPSGKLLKSIKINKSPLPVKKENKENFQDFVQDFYANRPRGEMIRKMAPYVQFPKTLPFYWRFFVDSVTGLVWFEIFKDPYGRFEVPIWQRGPIDEDAKNFEYLVVSIEKGIVAEGTIPFRIFDVRDNVIIGVHETLEGFQTVVEARASFVSAP